MRFAHVPKNQDDSDTLLDQNKAILAGLAASVVVALVCAVPAYFLLKAVASYAGQVVVAIWIIGVAVRFWGSKTYRNGLTVREFLLLLFWPLDLLLRTFYRGYGTGAHAALVQWFDEGSLRVPAVMAKIIGVLLVLVAFYYLVTTGFTALALPFLIIGLAIVLYPIVVVAQFWIASSWKDGLTKNELRNALLWPVSA